MRQKSFEILSKKKGVAKRSYFCWQRESLHFSATNWVKFVCFTFASFCLPWCLLPDLLSIKASKYGNKVVLWLSSHHCFGFLRRQLFLRLKNLRRNFFPTAPWQQKGDTMKRSSRRWKRLSLCRWSELWTWAPMSPCWNTTTKRLSIVYVAYVLFTFATTICLQL